MKHGLLLVMLLASFVCVRADDISADEKCGCQKPSHKIEQEQVEPAVEDTQPVNISCTEPAYTISEEEKIAETPANEAVVTENSQDESEKCPCSHVKPRNDEPEKCPCSQVKPRAKISYSIYDYLHNKCPGIVSVKCPCAKPHHKDIATRICNNIAKNPQAHRLEDSLEKCNCGHKPKVSAKDSTDGAELFIKATEAIMNCVTGGIVAHNTGNLEAGLAYVIDGVKEFINIASKSKNPEQVTQELYKFVASFDQQEMEQLLQASSAHAILQAEKRAA